LIGEIFLFVISLIGEISLVISVSVSTIGEI
jgi:hypothetical protein